MVLVLMEQKEEEDEQEEKADWNGAEIRKWIA